MRYGPIACLLLSACAHAEGSTPLPFDTTHAAPSTTAVADNESAHAIPAGFPAAAFGFRFDWTGAEAARACTDAGQRWTTRSHDGVIRGRCSEPLAMPFPGGSVSLRYTSMRQPACSMMFVAMASDDALLSRTWRDLLATNTAQCSLVDESTGTSECLEKAHRGDWSEVAAGHCSLSMRCFLSPGSVSFGASARSPVGAEVVLQSIYVAGIPCGG